MKKNIGFTLLELMVVIGIITILAALLFPAYSNMLERGRNAQCKANLRSLWRGAMSYMADFPDVCESSGVSAVPPRLPQYWLLHNTLVQNTTENTAAYWLGVTNVPWKGPTALLAITNDQIRFGVVNVSPVVFPSLFRYVDRDIRVYICPTFKNYMVRNFGITNAYRNYVINQSVAGIIPGRPAGLGVSVADMGVNKLNASDVPLFSEAIMPTNLVSGPATFVTNANYPQPSANRYHNGKRRGGMQFTNGTMNAVFVDGHIETM